MWTYICTYTGMYKMHAAKSLQLCPTLCNPWDHSPPGSAVPGILQARTLEWVAISFSSAWKWKVKVKSLRRVRPSATPWTTAHQAPPSMGFSRQEYWSGVPLPSPSITLWGFKSREAFLTGSERRDRKRQEREEARENFDLSLLTRLWKWKKGATG